MVLIGTPKGEEGEEEKKMKNVEGEGKIKCYKNEMLKRSWK
jgi:hypothetical protein